MNPSLKRFAIAVIAVATVLTVVVGALIVLMVVFEFPGGMPPSYRAADHDVRLTAIARQAVPVIQAIDRYYKAHGQCPRVSAEDAAELQNGLGQGALASIVAGEIDFQLPGAATGWMYYSREQRPSSCSLSRKLGWDPALVWLRDGDKTHWVFVPGDGTDEKPVQLDIEE